MPSNLKNNHLLKILFLLFALALPYNSFTQNAGAVVEDSASEEEIFAKQNSQGLYGPIDDDLVFESESNAIDAALVKDLKTGKQLIDLDIRSRPVYRYDTIMQPKEFIDNSLDEKNSHLPKVYTQKDMKRILFEAIKEENIPLLQNLMNSGDVDFNISDKNGNTLLDYAVKNKKYKAVKYLMYNNVGSRNYRTEYLDLALQYNDPNLIDIIEGVSPYQGDKFNERHVIRALEQDFEISVVSDIYDELTNAEKYELFNYYGEMLNGEGLDFLGIQGYNLDRKLRTGNRVLENGIAQERYKEADRLMWLKKYFSHNHIYSAYNQLISKPVEAVRLAPQIASYGSDYDLTHDIRDMEYVIICKEEGRKRFNFKNQNNFEFRKDYGSNCVNCGNSFDNTSSSDMAYAQKFGAPHSHQDLDHDIIHEDQDWLRAPESSESAHSDAMHDTSYSQDGPRASYKDFWNN